MIGIYPNDKAILVRIVEHCSRIKAAKERFGDSFEIFKYDLDFKDVICMNLFQIGELTNQLSDSIKNEIKNIEWDQIYGMRNILAHAYIQIDDAVIWETVEKDIQILKSKIDEII